MSYEPPYEITNSMLQKVASIMEKIGKAEDLQTQNKMPVLRKNSKIRSIHSSLAIENNPFSKEEVKGIIDGKKVIGPEKEIKEVQNAYEAYNRIDKIDPYSIAELKQVHAILGKDIIVDAGTFRKGEEGVFDGEVCIFLCPPPYQVDHLIKSLFIWMKKNKDIIHPLILSSIFHYEFVFIHPFSDGNGRMARLWHNVILSKWKDIFSFFPIESKIYAYQEEYYNAIAACHQNGNVNAFIEFMLQMIDETLDSRVTNYEENSEENINKNKMMCIMEDGIARSANEIMEALQIKSKKTLRKKYIDPAIKDDLIAYTIPEKPTSKNQKYYKK